MLPASCECRIRTSVSSSCALVGNASAPVAARRARSAAAPSPSGSADDRGAPGPWDFGPDRMNTRSWPCAGGRCCRAEGNVVSAVSAMVVRIRIFLMTASEYTATPKVHLSTEMPSVYLFATLDTKGTEADFIRGLLRSWNIPVTLVDVGALGAPAVTADVSRERIFELAGVTLAEVRRKADRGEAVTLAAAGAAALAQSAQAQDDLSGVLGLGGSAGTTIATSAMRVLPLGVPKVMLSTLASGTVRQFVGDKDIFMLNAVVDILGINRVSREVLSSAARAMAGLVTYPRPAAGAGDRPLVAATMFGVTTPCVERARALLESQGFEVLVFHATGNGGQAMESLISEGVIAGVLDLTTTELADEHVGGFLSAGPIPADGRGRWPASRRWSRPAPSTWSTSMRRRRCPERFAGRLFYRHNANVTLMRTTAGRTRRSVRTSRTSSKATGPGGRAAAGTRRLGDRSRRAAVRRSGGAPRAARRDQVGVARGSGGRADLHINDPEFAEAAAEADGMMMRSPSPIGGSGKPGSWMFVCSCCSCARRFSASVLDCGEDFGARRSEHHRQLSSGNPETLSREDRPRRADHRRRRGHRALGEERGRGRHRPADRLQLRPLSHGRPRQLGGAAGVWQRQSDREGDGVRGAAGRRRRRCWPASTGPTRSSSRGCFSRSSATLGFAGVQNFPTVGLFDGDMRQAFEETGMSYQLEVDIIRLARQMDLLTTPYVFNPSEAERMADAGADLIVAHMGVTTGGSIGAKSSKTLDDCVERIQAHRRRGPRREPGSARDLPRRADLGAARRGLHHSALPRRRRLLWRQLRNGCRRSGRSPNRFAGSSVSG